MPVSPNSTIAQYIIVSKIGEGGMGEVYRAREVSHRHADWRCESCATDCDSELDRAAEEVTLK